MQQAYPVRRVRRPSPSIKSPMTSDQKLDETLQATIQELSDRYEGRAVVVFVLPSNPEERAHYVANAERLPALKACAMLIQSEAKRIVSEMAQSVSGAPKQDPSKN